MARFDGAWVARFHTIPFPIEGRRNKENGQPGKISLRMSVSFEFAGVVFFR